MIKINLIRDSGGSGTPPKIELFTPRYKKMIAGLASVVALSGAVVVDSATGRRVSSALKNGVSSVYDKGASSLGSAEQFIRSHMKGSHPTLEQEVAAPQSQDAPQQKEPVYTIPIKSSSPTKYVDMVVTADFPGFRLENTVLMFFYNSVSRENLVREVAKQFDNNPNKILKPGDKFNLRMSFGNGNKPVVYTVSDTDYVKSRGGIPLHELVNEQVTQRINGIAADNELYTDNRAVIDGKVERTRDGERGDEVPYGKKVTLTGYKVPEQAVKGKSASNYQSPQADQASGTATVMAQNGSPLESKTRTAYANSGASGTHNDAAFAPEGFARRFYAGNRAIPQEVPGNGVAAGVSQAPEGFARRYLKNKMLEQKLRAA